VFAIGPIGAATRTRRARVVQHPRYPPRLRPHRAAALRHRRPHYPGDFIWPCAPRSKESLAQRVEPRPDRSSFAALRIAVRGSRLEKTTHPRRLQSGWENDRENTPPPCFCNCKGDGPTTVSSPFRKRHFGLPCDLVIRRTPAGTSSQGGRLSAEGGSWSFHSCPSNCAVAVIEVLLHDRVEDLQRELVVPVGTAAPAWAQGVAEGGRDGARDVGGEGWCGFAPLSS